MTTSTTLNTTYQDIFKTENGKTYLSALPKLEKITSGQSFLYRQNGAPSMVIDIRLTNDIDAAYLQQSVYKSLQRYPYLTSQLVEKDANYYLSKNDRPLIVAETDQLRALGSDEVNQHLIDVTFSEKTIFIAYHHAIADGRGIMPFVETLLYYYLGYKSNTWPEIEHINLSDDTMSEDEMLEPLENLESQPISETNKMPDLNHRGYQLLETKGQDATKSSYRYEIVLDQESFMTYAKKHNATPAIAVAIIMAQAIQKAYPDFELPIVAHMASDLRLGVTNQNTFRNCVGSIALPVNQPIVDDEDFTAVATEFRNLIKQSKQISNLRANVNQMANLFEKLDSLPTIEAKQQMLSFFENILLNTFIISYSGQTKLGELEQYIDEMHTYMSGTNGLSIEMLAINGGISVDILQSFESDVYVKGFTDILAANNIDFKINDTVLFEVPNDKLSR